MVEDVVGDFIAYGLAIIAGETEVNACKNAGVPHFVQPLRKAPEGTGDADEEIVVHGEMRPFAEEAGEDRAGRSAHGGMARRVFRMRGSGKQPGSRNVAVGHAQVERGDGHVLGDPAEKLEIARPHDRVTDETAPVKVLEPAHPIFTTPNRIGPGKRQIIRPAGRRRSRIAPSGPRTPRTRLRYSSTIACLTPKGWATSIAPIRRRIPSPGSRASAARP